MKKKKGCTVAGHRAVGLEGIERRNMFGGRQKWHGNCLACTLSLPSFLSRLWIGGGKYLFQDSLGFTWLGRMIIKLNPTI